ncbi:MAG TPA: PAS domain-containing protein [Gammaproteobacteria bacterium]|nr:PAS domain-containing protein [Gammaproteobacteria bacterium]
MLSAEFKAASTNAETIAKLLHPYAETVVHNLKTNKIVSIFNAFSKRKAGDDSLLDVEKEFDLKNEILGPYEKINWDGRRLKSISNVIRDGKGRPIGIYCINLDISVLMECQQLLQAFMQTEDLSLRPAVLFKDDWQERIHQFVHDYIQERNWHFRTLTLEQKKILVMKLHQEGAFEAKNAAQYIASILKVSRATIYNYLNLS